MFILYVELHFLLVHVENTPAISNTFEHATMSSAKKSTLSVVDENIFETLERDSLNAKATIISPKHKNKRKQTTFDEETKNLSSRIQRKKARLS